MRQPGAGGQAALPAHLKEINRQRILRVILSGRVLTVADIHAETSISRPTVMRALQDYMRMGVVRSLGPGSTTSAGGKKPELFCFADARRRFWIIISGKSRQAWKNRNNCQYFSAVSR